MGTAQDWPWSPYSAVAPGTCSSCMTEASCPLISTWSPPSSHLSHTTPCSASACLGLGHCRLHSWSADTPSDSHGLADTSPAVGFCRCVPRFSHHASLWGGVFTVRSLQWGTQETEVWERPLARSLYPHLLLRRGWFLFPPTPTSRASCRHSGG